MKLVIVTPPTLEPITIGELKLHLHLDSSSFVDNIDETQSIAPGSHAIANNYTTHVGAWVEVLGYNAVVIANYGILTVGGVVDIKIQETDDQTTITDVTSGAFTQVTISATASTQEKAYTGVKRYIRTVAKVITQASEFNASVIRNAATSAEDDLLTEHIVTARQFIEDGTGRALLTQTWDMFLNKFPANKDYIEIPFGNLQSVTHVKYTDSGGTQTTMTVTTDYLVQTNGEQCGRIVLPYGISWPSDILYPSNPIVIRFICGWTTAALVPSKIRTAMKMICADLYEGRGEKVQGQTVIENKTVDRLIWLSRLWGEF